MLDPFVRLLRGGRRAGRRRAGRPIPLTPPDWRVERGAATAHGQDARPAAQLAAQPHRPRARPRRARAAGRGLPPARPDRRHRRGLRAPRLRRRRAHPARHAAGDVRAHADGVVDGQDVLGHRLEDRLGERPGRAGGGRPRRQAVPDLRRRHAAAARRRGRAARRRGRAGASWPPRWRASATACPTGLAAPASTSFATAGTYFINADARPLGFDDAMALCERLPLEAGVVAIPMSAFTADPERLRSLVRFAFCKREEVLREAVASGSGLGEASPESWSRVLGRLVRASALGAGSTRPRFVRGQDGLEPGGDERGTWRNVMLYKDDTPSVEVGVLVRGPVSRARGEWWRPSSRAAGRPWRSIAATTRSSAAPTTPCTDSRFGGARAGRTAPAASASARASQPPCGSSPGRIRRRSPVAPRRIPARRRC